ncbi:phenazine-1-carboxylate N-methyltransferase PhzM [Streptomyces thioluteus]|uniref:Phenazine-1-carboxylate N-methyltransferase PhzM n=1 Tax=Streptomyces thioluteus TaxID=66431 RepID=A0ABN3WV17_STRTU
MAIGAEASRTTVDLITAAWRTQAVYAAAKLGLPDLVAAGNTDDASLARATGMDEDVVHRLMRLLVLLGVFTSDRGYAATEVGELLQERPESLRDMCLLYGEEFYSAWGHAEDAFRTGASGFEKVHGQPLIPYLRGNGEAAGRFQRAMQASNFYFDSIPQEIDFSGDRHIVDIAGGSGQLLSTVLRGAPQARGTLVDLEHTMPIARAHFEQTVGTDRVDLVVADMFSGALPAAADTYLLSRVLGDWEEEPCLRLLANLRSAMSDDSRLIVVERLTRDDGTGLLPALWDLHLYVLNGGRQRTLDSTRDLAARSGLTIERSVELPSENTALILKKTPA